MNLDDKLVILAKDAGIDFVPDAPVRVVDGWLELIDIHGFKIMQRMNGTKIQFKVTGECILTPGEFAFLATWFDTQGWIGPWEESR